MTMTPAAEALADCIQEWWTRIQPSSGDCRVVVPAPTLALGLATHNCVLGRGLPSFFVTSGRASSPQPSERSRVLRAEAVTSVRDGSFVVIVEPGELSKLQESIQGSGGGIRGLAIPDEWPWVEADSGFDFFLNFFPRWAVSAQYPSDEMAVAKGLLRKAIGATEAVHNRAEILFDEILAKRFDVGAPASERVDQFAIDIGVPSIVGPTGLGPGVPAESLRVLDGLPRVVEAMEGSSAREAVEQNAAKAFDELGTDADGISQEDFRGLLHGVLDRMRTESGRGKGALTLRATLPTCPEHWRILTLPVLRRVFVESSTTSSISLEAVWASGGHALLLPGNRHCIIAKGSAPEIKTVVERPDDLGVRIEAKAGRRRVGEMELPAGIDAGAFTADTSAVDKGSITITVTAGMEHGPRVASKLCLEQPTEEGNCFVVVAVTDPDELAVRAVRRLEGGGDEEQKEEESIDVNEQTSLYFVAPEGSPEVVLDGAQLEYEEVAPGVFRLPVDVSSVAAMGFQPELVCRSAGNSIAVPLSVEHRQGGACNLEAAMVAALGRTRSGVLPKLAKAWEGTEDARPLLGSPGDELEKRFKLVDASFEATEGGWKPVVLRNDAMPGGRLAEQDWIRVPEDPPGSRVTPILRAALFSAEATALLRAYTLARDGVQGEISRRHGKKSRVGLSLYAAASFHYEPGDSLDLEVRRYLQAFEQIQRQLSLGGLSWAECFVLAHLDTVVLTHEDASGWMPIGCVIGPWHPLVVAKRMMVGRGLFRLANIEGRDPCSWMRGLGGLLTDVVGFRWFAALLPDSVQPDPFFVEATDDPGWMFARPAREGGQSQDSRALAATLGLSVSAGGAGEGRGLKGYLSDFLRAYPSRRAIAVEAGRGMRGPAVAAAAREFLGGPEECTAAGKLLRGGVHIIIEGEGGDEDDYPEWEQPLVCVYPNGGAGFKALHKVDINLGDAATRISYPMQMARASGRSAPRGTGPAAVLQMPFRTLEETANRVRDSRLSFNTYPQSGGDDLGVRFVGAVIQAQSATGPHKEVGVRTLSHAIGAAEAVWTILPGDGIDPAVLLDWTRSSVRDEVPRVLWDYRMAISQASRSYFVLSEVPEVLVQRLAGSPVFQKSRERAGHALLELGSIGIALGSETFKSRARALGVVGLVGAARMATALLETICGDDQACRWFLLPVDSFGDLLGGDLESYSEGADSRRADLAGVVCRIRDSGVEFAFLAVESKYCGVTFGLERARSALGQAARTLQRLMLLGRASREGDALAERLAFARLVEFGLRLDAENTPDLISTAVSAILRGDHRVSVLGATGCMVVSTEVGSSKSEVQPMQEGWWVRLAPTNWPGEAGDVQTLVDELAEKNLPGWRARVRSLGPTGASPCGRREHPHVPSDAAGGAGAASVTQSPPTSGSKDTSEDKGVPRLASGAAINREELIAPTAATKQPEGGEQQSGSGLQRSGEIPEADDGAEPAQVPDDLRPSGDAHGGAVRLLLGVGEDGQPLEWVAGANSNHNFMVTGSSGTGKTQLLKSMLWQARKQGLPALILDFKNDFAPDAAFLQGARLDVQYVAYQGLPYNPLIPCEQILPHTGRPGYPISQHITGIVSAFQKTYGLGEQQAADLKSAIRSAFDEVGMPSFSVVERLPEAFPDFSAVGKHLREINRLAYNRLDPLFDLEIFREEYRDVPFNRLLGRGYVLDLSGIQSAPIQNTLSMLLVYSAHRYLNALPHASSVEQLLVFDEAHRVLASEDVEALVRECRAYGLGVILSSQYPTDFPPDTAANLATKVLHGNGPDVGRIQGIRAMLGLPAEVEQKLDLPMFQAVIRAKPGTAIFARTVGFPHWLVLEALKDGSKVMGELASIDGIHPTRLSAAIKHLEMSGLVTCKGDEVEIAG